MAPKFVLYPTVLPVYRTECMRLLQRDLGSDLRLFASRAHLDPSVKTGLPEGTYELTRMLRVAGRLYVQVGGWRQALSAHTLIADLNPRSGSNWLFLLARKVLRRRTLLWGHLHPRSGPASRTAWLRRRMLRTADGFVAYTPGQADLARRETPAQPVWIAANALYTRAQLRQEAPALCRRDVLYVGRLEQEKRVDFLMEAFAQHATTHSGSRLVLVGSGVAEPDLRLQARRLKIDDRVDFAGWIDGFDQLRDRYASAFCSVSPGFAGLGLTQSLGFGVPQVVADNQVHSPEIELAQVRGSVRWFDGSSPAALAIELGRALADTGSLPSLELRDAILEHYSAESMAEGLRRAFTDTQGGKNA